VCAGVGGWAGVWAGRGVKVIFERWNISLLRTLFLGGRIYRFCRKSSTCLLEVFLEVFHRKKTPSHTLYYGVCGRGIREFSFRSFCLFSAKTPKLKFKTVGQTDESVDICRSVGVI
jgi:hypothetical protein